MKNLISRSSVRRVVRTFLVAFVALAGPGLLGWLNDLTAWASSQGATPFPDAHGLGYLAVSATVAGVIAVVNIVLTTIEDVTGKGLLRDMPEPKVSLREDRLDGHA